MRALAVSLCVIALVTAGVAGQLREPPIPHARGQSVTPAFEGWFPNPDGTFSISFGYFNRNLEEILDIPVGPNNRVDIAGSDAPDQGQPTHFLPRRHTGVFTIIVPKDFGTAKVLTWTIVSGGERLSVPGHLQPAWKIDALKEPTSGNTPPVVRFAPSGASGQGPSGLRVSRTATVGVPIDLDVWVTDDGIFKATGGGEARPALGVVWSQFRGPAAVKFSHVEPKLESGKATTAAEFKEPGDYVLNLLAWDSSGRPGLVMAGGFQCCWTNGYVDVSVASSAKTSGPTR
jgi:hypothetical protein